MKGRRIPQAAILYELRGAGGPALGLGKGETLVAIAVY